MHLLFLFLTSFITLFANDKDIQFISYNKVPSWTGIASQWKKNPSIHLYDSKEYIGHAYFVAKKLNKQINFEEFKRLCKSNKDREYFPFFYTIYLVSHSQVNLEK